MKKTFTYSITILLIVLASACSTQVDQDKIPEPSPNSPNLFLLSKGLVTDTLKAEFLDFFGKTPSNEKVAVIPNASSTHKKMLKKTRKAKNRFSSMGFDSSRVEMFDISIRSPQELREYDIIYILGGYPFKLLEEARQKGLDTTLERLAYEDHILMGYSAGSLLLGPSLDLLNAADSILEFNDKKMTQLDCIGLYTFHIFPHFTDFTSQAPELVDVIDHFEQETGDEVIRLNDGQAVVVKNGAHRIVGTILEPEAD